MIEIDKIYLFKTIDKSPYVFTPDANIFGAIVIDGTVPTLLTSLQIDVSNTTKFDTCIKAYFDYDSNLDFEKQLPADGAIPHISGAIYNYRIKLMRENTTKIYDSDFNRYVSYFSGDVFQVLFHTIDDNWFILYAEFEITNTVVENDVVQTIELQALDAKEEKYQITTLTEI